MQFSVQDCYPPHSCSRSLGLITKYFPVLGANSVKASWDAVTTKSGFQVRYQLFDSKLTSLDLKGKEHKNLNGFCLKLFGKLDIFMQTA